MTTTEASIDIGFNDKYDYTVLCRHCDLETTTPLTCQLVTGEVPSWLEGLLVYNGPGLTKVGETEYLHAFDSSGILQRFQIQDGCIQYYTRYVRSATFKQNQELGIITKSEFGTPAPAATNRCKLSRLWNAMDAEKMFSDNALVSVCNIGGRYFAMAETPFMLEIDPSTLNVLERINMNKMHGLITQSPHPLPGEEGTTYTMGQGIGLTGPKYNILRFPADGNIKNGKVVASVPARWRLSPSYMHSMALSENYAIIIEQPLSVSISELMSDIMNNVPFIEGLKWHDAVVLIHVLDRKTWKHVKTRYVHDAFFFLHIANSYEEDDHIVIDVPAYKNASMLHQMFIKTLREARKVYSPEFAESFQSTLKRIVIPLVTTSKGNLITLSGTTCTAQVVNHDEVKLISETLVPFSMDNPIVNPAYHGKKHQYIWAMGSNPDGGDSGFVVKVDASSGATIIFSEAGLYPADPVFIARPNATMEDDGIILVLCVSSHHEKLATCLILDASTLTEICRATVQAPAPVPMPLHGTFIPLSK